MFKSKKMFALCATTLAGFSTLATLPITAMADVAKTGDTTISYEGSGPKPAEWGLSVPSALSLGANRSYPNSLQANATLAIVKEDGSAFDDNTKDHTFIVSGVFNSVENDKYYYVNKSDKSQKAVGQYRIFDQGATVTDWGGKGGSYNSEVNALASGVTINSFVDNRMPASRIVQFQSEKTALDGANANGSGLDARVSWTASKQN